MTKRDDLQDAVNDWECTIRSIEGLGDASSAIEYAERHLAKAKDKLDRYDEDKAKRDSDKRMFRPPPGKSFGGRVYEVKK